MKKYHLYQFCLCVLAALMLSRTFAEESRSLEDYSILAERNIFSRNRGKKKEAASAIVHTPEVKPVPPPPPPKPTEKVILVGIVKRGDESVAFFEREQSKKSDSAKPGDAFAEGQIAAITATFVEFKKDGKTLRIEIGEHLIGLLPEGVTPAPGTSTDGEEKANETPATQSKEIPKSTGPVNPILERLRQRRLQELKK